MASWIKMRTSLDTDARVVNIANHTGVGLGVGIRTIVGCLHFLWSLADEHTTNGKLIGYTPASIDHMTVPKFAEALQLPSVKWIGVDSDGFVFIADFKRHNGDSAKSRARNAVRAAGLRGKPRAQDRAQNAHDTRTKPAPRAEAEQNRSRGQAEGRINTKGRPSPLPLCAPSGTACSLLQDAGFEQGAIDAILKWPDADHCKVQYACERWLTESKAYAAGKRTKIGRQQGYIRSIIESREPAPREYRDAWNKKRLEASSLKLAGATA